MTRSIELGVGRRLGHADRIVQAELAQNQRAAAEASTPLRPVTCSANSPSAAESTTPPPPPAADGSDTATPWRAPTAATAASMTLSTVAASASAPSCSPPSAPPRTLEPSRVPSATSTVTCLTQPSPSSQVLLDPLGDVGRPLAGRAEHRAQLIVDRVGKHWAERLVGAGQLGDLSLQPGQIGLGRAVDGTEVELGAQVDQQLVASRRRTVGDRLDRIQRLDLVDAHLRRQRDQRHRGVGRVVTDVVGPRTAATARQARAPAPPVQRPRRRLRPPRRRARRLLVLVLRLRIGVGGEQHRRVALGVRALRLCCANTRAA